MNKQLTMGFVKLGLLLAITVIAAGTSAQAQSLEYRLTANIPFEFNVADKKLPAGEYSISRAQQNSGDLVVQISAARGPSILSHLTIPVNTLEPKEKGRLVFHRYGDDYFLYEIWPAGATTGRELMQSHREREVQRKLRENVGAANLKTPRPQRITIVVNVR